MSRSQETLIVHANETLLAHSIGEYLRATCPNIPIVFQPKHRLQAHKGVDVAIEPAGRWMCVIIDKSEIATARAALSNDAWCIASFDDPPRQFQLAIEALLTGDPYHLPIAFAKQIASSSSTPQRSSDATPSAGHTPLTNREREVLALVARGLANIEIADTMGISIHTVRTHLSSMATKMDANNRVRMVARATQLGYPEAASRAQ